jgi:hypothetical protein
MLHRSTAVSAATSVGGIRDGSGLWVCFLSAGVVLAAAVVPAVTAAQQSRQAAGNSSVGLPVIASVSAMHSVQLTAVSLAQAAAACSTPQVLAGHAVSATSWRISAARLMYQCMLWCNCRADPFCEEALSALVDNHMLTNKQELELIDRLPLQPDDRWLALLYRAKCKKVCPCQPTVQHVHGQLLSGCCCHTTCQHITGATRCSFSQQ